jgi:Beta-galactosidase
VKAGARSLALAGGAAAAVGFAALSGVRLTPSQRRLDGAWRRSPVESRGSTLLGISFRPLQAEAFGLDPRATLVGLLGLPFHTVRLAAYWNHIEPEPGAFRTAELDWQLDAAERAGKQVVLCVGAAKAFGYPEFFVPAHELARPLPEGSLVDASSHPQLLAASTQFVRRIVERYRERPCIAGWQVEHEAVDPLGMEHSWRLGFDFVAEEVAAVRRSDPTRPVVMNGFLPATPPVRLQQWWRTRDQGDSLAVAGRLADVVGIDYYPRHALAGTRGWGIYMNGACRRLPRAAGVAASRARSGTRPGLMVTEGQAEPWEARTVPPSPASGKGMYSCLPEHIIRNYNRCMSWSREVAPPLSAYLFWGAEYWVLRHREGDPSYLQAFERVLSLA